MTPAPASPDGGLVVLDDDPTGTQAAAGVPVLLDLSAGFLAGWFAAHQPQPVYVLTNTRALPPAQARQTVADVASAVRARWPDARFVCRGDSTLRGHLLADYRGVTDGAPAPVLLLAPAMPSAGRVTVGGRHYLITDDGAVDLAATEYARDPDFGYPDSGLLAWASERSAGLFASDAGTVVELDQLRRGGGAGLAATLTALAQAGRPAACACDSETEADLALVADGLARAWAAGVPVAVRCAPPLAALLAGRPATATCPPPAARARLLVVVGSYVRASSSQLSEVSRRWPGRVAEAGLAALLTDPQSEQARLAEVITGLWDTGPLAVLATPRGRPAAGSGARGLTIARRLAGVLAVLPQPPEAVLSRGGVTSAVVASAGLGGSAAWVCGPVRPGIVLWQVSTAAGVVPLLIAAGNVGGPADLASLIEEMVA